MVLNRNPDNFFAETEQVAFCTAHIVPGLDFSNDPLLAGRIHSYVDTQISRLGGPNFHEIPINAPVAQVHNNQRDGMHRQAIPRGRVAYEPNSLGGGCPFQAGVQGFMSFPQPTEEHKVRGKPEKFAEHYNQATLFWKSQTAVEKQHIIRAFRFELTKVQTAAVRERVVAQLRNVAEELATAVADGLGMTELPDPLPKAVAACAEAGSADLEGAVTACQARARKASRRGASRSSSPTAWTATAALAMHEALAAEGAVPRFVGVKLGQVTSASGEPLEVGDLDGNCAGRGVGRDDRAGRRGRCGRAERAAVTRWSSSRISIVTASRFCSWAPPGRCSKQPAFLPKLPSGEADPGLLQFDAAKSDAALPAFVAALTQASPLRARNRSAARVTHISSGDMS